VKYVEPWVFASLRLKHKVYAISNSFVMSTSPARGVAADNAAADAAVLTIDLEAPVKEEPEDDDAAIIEIAEDATEELAADDAPQGVRGLTVGKTTEKKHIIN
jgi:hypothetical protein